MSDSDDKAKIAFAQALRLVRENLPAHIEYERLRARLMREKYLELIKQGFTEAQALELCKS